MSAFGVNLRQYYQRWGLYYYYFIALVLLVQQVFMLVYKGRGQCLMGVLISMMLGVLVGSSQRAILSRPFSFCLPGHDKVLQKVVQWSGIVAGLPAGLMFLLDPELDVVGKLSAGLGAYGLGLVLYSVAILGAFAGKTDRTGLFATTPLFAFLLVFMGGDALVRQMIIVSWWGCLTLGLIGLGLIWCDLGKRDFARRDCGRNMNGVMESMNLRRARKVGQQLQAERWARMKKREVLWFENCCVGLMGRYGVLSMGRAICGSIYEMVGVLVNFGLWKFVLFGFAMALFYGYVPWGGARMVNMIYAMTVFMGLQVRLPIWGSCLLANGRRERFWGTVAGSFVVAILVVGMVVIIGVVTNILVGVLPELHYRTVVTSFSAMSLRIFYIPLMYMAIVYSVNALLESNDFFIWFLFFATFIAGTAWHDWLLGQAVIVGVGLTVGAWFVYVFVLWLRLRYWRIGGR